MPKYYVTLIDRASNQMQVPVKADLNPYNQRQAYCAGMPQIFGGTDMDDRPPAIVLGQEVTQESRRTLKLTSDSPSYFFTEGNMFFYWASEDQWQRTGNPWEQPQSNEEAEMERIVVVDLTQFDNGMNDNEIIMELVAQTGCGEAPHQGVLDFNASATRTAFIILIRMHLADQL